MEQNNKVYHLNMIYRPNHVIKDIQGRHTNVREEYIVQVGVLDNFKDLVEVCSRIDHTNAHIPKNLSKRFGFWGTSFDKRDPTPRDSLKMVTKEQAEHIMIHGPSGNNMEREDDVYMDFLEREERERDEMNREQMEEDYEVFLEDIRRR